MIGRCIAYTSDMELTFYGDGNSDTAGCFIHEDGIEGWYSSPDLKTDVAERNTGDGSHDVLESNILYSSRVVTVHFNVNGATRSDLVSLFNRLSRLNHRMVKLRFIDEFSDTYVTGMCNLTIPGEYGLTGWIEDCTLNVTCPNPERLSWDVFRCQLLPTSNGDDNGLVYDETNHGLSYPLKYGSNNKILQNVGTLSNYGSATAYPIITVNGSFNNGVRIDSDGLSLFYTQPVGAVPLVLDSRSRTANIGGTDVTRFLQSRGFPTIPAGGSATFSLQSSGTGWVTVECNDTYV